MQTNYKGHLHSTPKGGKWYLPPPQKKKFEILTNINCYVGNSGLDLDLRTLCDIKIKSYQTYTPYSKMSDKLLSFCLQVVD